MRIDINHKTFEVNPYPFKGFWDDIASTNWEKETFRAFDICVSENDVVLDVGCWAGPLTLYAAHLAKEVHAIDPDPVIFEQLLHNVRLNPRLSAKIKCYKAAISNKTGKQPLFARSNYGFSSSSILSRVRDQISNEMVFTYALHDFLTQNEIKEVDFIKMDIEGGEFLALPTLEKTLKSLNYPTLLISFHSSHLIESIYKQKIKSSCLAKALMKVEKISALKLFKSSYLPVIRNALSSLRSYNFIYNLKGSLVSKETLIERPEFINNQTLIFTNKMYKW